MLVKIIPIIHNLHFYSLLEPRVGKQRNPGRFHGHDMRDHARHHVGTSEMLPTFQKLVGRKKNALLRNKHSCQAVFYAYNYAFACDKMECLVFDLPANSYCFHTVQACSRRGGVSNQRTIRNPDAASISYQTPTNWKNLPWSDSLRGTRPLLINLVITN